MIHIRTLITTYILIPTHIITMVLIVITIRMVPHTIIPIVIITVTTIVGGE